MFLLYYPGMKSHGCELIDSPPNLLILLSSFRLSFDILTLPDVILEELHMLYGRASDNVKEIDSSFFSISFPGQRSKNQHEHLPSPMPTLQMLIECVSLTGGGQYSASVW